LVLKERAVHSQPELFLAYKEVADALKLAFPGFNTAIPKEEPVCPVFDTSKECAYLHIPYSHFVGLFTEQTCHSNPRSSNPS